MTLDRPAPSHWVKANEACRIPRTHIVLDAESYVNETATGELHTFRCAVTCCDRMRKRDDTWEATVWANHDTPASVWEWIVERGRPRMRTVVVAHNAGYDLRVTDAFAQLDRLGWELAGIQLTPGATWGTWRREGASIVVVDSLTWLPMPLQKVGDLVGLRKQALPQRHDGGGPWWLRARTDVEILRDAWHRIVRWLRTVDAGNWRPTGAGTGWSFWRHKHYTHRVLAHDDAELRARERLAGWTGRAEAWRTGRLGRGPWTEFDFSAAYARVAATCDVPTVRLAEASPQTLRADLRATPGRAVLLDCTVTTEAPTVPTAGDHGIVWPVGTFRTTLWDHEARLALRHGATVQVERATWYRTAPALASWAQWCLDVADGGGGVTDPVVRAMVKHWSRAVIGRTGARYAKWERFGELPTEDFSLGWWFDGDSDDKARLLQVGRRLMTQGGLADGADAVPAIMSWIMAECRVRLWSAMETAGLDHVAYVDTDALIVDPVGAARLTEAGLPGLRQKGRWRSLEIVGTRKLIIDGRLRAAGVQRDAVHQGGRVWEAEAWNGLSSSLSVGEHDRVSVHRRRINLGGVERRRVRLPGGGTVPVRLSL